MASFMLRAIPAIVFLLGLTVVDQSLAQDRVQQELDRVSELLQRLGREELSKEQSDAVPASRTKRASNPFSDKGAESQPESGTPPKVSIDQDTIRINVNGQELRIARPKPSERSQHTPSALPADFTGGLLQALDEPDMKRVEIYQQYALALSAFHKRDYDKAKSLLKDLEESIENEGAVAQTYALILFQTGDFQRAAEWAYNSLQSVKPFDWKTIQGLYGHPSDYASRYKELQTASRNEPERIELHFLLAYHHLMLGHRRHAEAELKLVQQSLDADPLVLNLIQETQTPFAEPPQPLSR